MKRLALPVLVLALVAGCAIVAPSDEGKLAQAHITARHLFDQIGDLYVKGVISDGDLEAAQNIARALDAAFSAWHVAIVEKDDPERWERTARELLDGLIALLEPYEGRTA